MALHGEQGKRLVKLFLVCLVGEGGFVSLFVCLFVVFLPFFLAPKGRWEIVEVGWTVLFADSWFINPCMDRISSVAFCFTFPDAKSGIVQF